MQKIWEDFLYPNRIVDYPTQEKLQQWRQHLTTNLGGLSAGFRSDFWLRGYKMISQATGKVTFTQAFVLALTGKLPNVSEDKLINAIFTDNALTDPRFWLFKNARLGATVKTTPAAAIAAGLFANEGEWLSSGAAYNISTFFKKVLSDASKNHQLAEIIKEKLKKNETISGYGRVLARGPDERNPALLSIAKKYNLDSGKFLKLSFEIEKLLQENKNSNLYLNNGGLVCALLLDMGFLPNHIMLFYHLVFFIGIAGNIVEAYDEPPGKFLPLSIDDIDYTGPRDLEIPNKQNQFIVYEDINGKIVTMDSISFLNDTNNSDVIVCGSHGGYPAAEYCLDYNLKAVIFNDAGIGKELAGIEGLNILDEYQIPAATVSHNSAKIGDGSDTYHNGILSYINKTCSKFNIQTGMKANDASKNFLKNIS